MSQTRITLALALAVGLGLSACSDPPPLSATQLPAGFHMETTKTATLKLTGSAAALGASGVGNVEVKRVDGPLLYWGPITAAQPAAIAVSLPSYQTSVDVVLHTKDAAPQTARVALVGADASHSF